MTSRRLLLLAASALATSACEKSPAPPTEAPSAPAAPATPAPYVPDSRFVKEAPAPAAAPAPAKPEGEQLFSRYGCTACHNPGAAFYDKLVGAKGKSEQQVAQWILNPRATKPDTMMPAYGNQLTEEQARALARWVLAGNPGGWAKK